MPTPCLALISQDKPDLFPFQHFKGIDPIHLKVLTDIGNLDFFAFRANLDFFRNNNANMNFGICYNQVVSFSGKSFNRSTAEAFLAPIQYPSAYVFTF